MANPFGEADDTEETATILEGFLCPICRKDLKTFEFLEQHFEREHSEEPDAIKSIFRDIYTKAKKKLKQNFDDSFDLSKNFDKSLKINGGEASESGGSSNNVAYKGKIYKNIFMEEQGIGVERSHFQHFQSYRNPRLERYASETNRLIIRLHKLLKDMPTDPTLRKQHEQIVVVWLDGSSVKLCPNCAKSFNFARRQHHCRLCGSIMCHDCSQFLAISTALELASLSITQADSLKQQSEKVASASQPLQSLRTCDHCLWLLETRQEMHESRTCRPPITQIYAEIQQLKKDVEPDLATYTKIISSLYSGESIFNLSDASALRGKIGHVAELIELRSKRIMALPCEEGSREHALKKDIRLSCIQMIKDKMLSLPPLPAEEEIRRIQEMKRIETEQRIETERRQALETYERYGLGVSKPNEQFIGSGYAMGSDLQSLDSWSTHQISTSSSVPDDDPLVIQINNIKGYIRQARQELNFDVVETLEINLRELQREFYERQRRSGLENDLGNRRNDEERSTFCDRSTP